MRFTANPAFGIDRVRGGSFSAIDIEPQRATIVLMLQTRANTCYRYGAPGHYANASSHRHTISLVPSSARSSLRFRWHVRPTRSHDCWRHGCRAKTSCGARFRHWAWLGPFLQCDVMSTFAPNVWRATLHRRRTTVFVASAIVLPPHTMSTVDVSSSTLLFRFSLSLSLSLSPEQVHLCTLLIKHKRHLV